MPTCKRVPLDGVFAFGGRYTTLLCRIALNLSAMFFKSGMRPLCCTWIANSSLALNVTLVQIPFPQCAFYSEIDCGNVSKYFQIMSKFSSLMIGVLIAKPDMLNHRGTNIMIQSPRQPGIA